MTFSITSYLNRLNVNFKINNEVIQLLNYPYAIYFVDKNNTKTYGDLLELRQKVKTIQHKHLVFIWWDLWQNNTDIVKSKIKHLLGLSTKIHARKTVVKAIDKDLALNFQTNNHLMIALPGYKRLGLFLDDKLIAVAVFAKKRKFRDDSYSAELLRFSTLNNTHINGGLSKLIKAFTLQHPINSLMTYVDLDWSDGSKFERIGFEVIDQQQPLYFKLSDSKRILCTKEQHDVFNLGSLKLLLAVN